MRTADAPLADEALVTFLLNETGDALHAVVRYDDDSWRLLYRSERAESVFDSWERASDDEIFNLVVADFRRDAEANHRRGRLLGVGDYRCSLHLFENWAIIHFTGSDESGVVFAYDSTAASHLSSFVDLCEPYVRDTLSA